MPLDVSMPMDTYRRGDEYVVELELPGVDPGSIEEQAETCHYRDCTQGSEPGCAVRAAVEKGLVSAERFAAWESLRKEAANAALRADEHGRRAAERRFGSVVKNYQRFKNKV